MPPSKTSSATHLHAGAGATTVDGDASALRSSWIRRLLPRHSPVSPNNFRHLPPIPNPTTTSDFAARRYSTHSSPPPAPPPTTRLASAFGPFQAGTRRDGGGEDHSNRGGLRLPPSFHFLSPLRGPEFTSNYQPTSSSSNWRSAPPPADLRPERPRRRSVGEFVRSVQHEWRSRGGTCHDSISGAGASTCGRFPDALALHHCDIQGHRAEQTPNFLNETEDSFSYWNMGRVKRTSTGSSVSPVTYLCRDLGRKRNSDADALIYSKLRKMGTED